MLIEAVDAEAITRSQVEDLDERFTLEVRADWDRMMSEWEHDHSKPNPYEEPAIHGTPFLHSYSSLVF